MNEKNTRRTPEQLFEQAKDKRYQVQKAKVYQVFQRKPATMLMAAVEVGVLRANICRMIAEWEDKGLIIRVRKGFCEISKHRSGYYIATLKPSKP